MQSEIFGPIRVASYESYKKIKVDFNGIHTHPISKLPKNPPMQIPDAIHDASSLVIGPVSRGVSSDFRIGMLELGQPHVAP